MSMYLKALGSHVYFATIKDSYFVNGKNLEANAKALHALKSTLNDDYLFRISNIYSIFVVWNTLYTLDEQTLYDKESNSDDRSATSNMYYIVQGDDLLEVNTESELDEDVDMPYDELAMFCQLLKKYELLKMENKSLKNENDLV